MKKILKITGIVILVLIILLVATPFLFKGTIEKQVKKAINQNLNATVEWSDLSLSLISSFPDARLKLENVSVINKALFAGDTLVYAKTLFLDMGIPQLFKGGDAPLSVNELGLNQALVNIKVNKKGQANYDIAKETADNSASEDTTGGGISLAVQHYEINDSRINYIDESSKMALKVSRLNHQGTGDFSADTSILHTQTEAQVTFIMDSTAYLSQTPVKLDADIKMDLKNMRFTFEKNKALINQLPLTFNGYVQVNDNNQQLDITFKTPSSDFKNFLGALPKAYAKNLDNIKTTGNFSVNGRLYGVIDDQHIPKMKIAVKSNNASFKYPDLPKAVSNITIDAVLKDETGLMKDLNLDLNQLTFKIDQDAFAASGHFKNLTGNMLVDLQAKGTLNLANLNKAYPIDTELDLNGILNMDMRTSFAMNDIEKERYENIKSYGSANLSNFEYSSAEMAHPIQISTAKLHFDPGNVVLEKFDMKTGQTDAHLSGKLQNLMGYLFKNQPIKGNFKLTSHTFSVNDFMIAQTEEPSNKTTEEEKSTNEKASTTTEEEAIKVPSFLDVALNFSADKVLYDNLTLNNASGTLILRDEKAILKGIKAHIFDGTIGLDGSVDTKPKTPKFNVKLSLDKIDLVQSVQEMDLLKKFAPITKALVGELTTSINLDGDLTNDLMPIYTTLTGKGLAALLNIRVEEGKLPLLSKLNQKLNFIDFNKLNINNLTTHFTFEDGGIKFKPFTFKLTPDIQAKISGKHSFTNQMNYKLDLKLPAKYLGKDLASGLAKLSNTELKSTKVDLPVEFSGSLTQPKIKVDVKAATQALTNRIVQSQKEELKNKVGNKLQNLLSGGNKKDKTTADKSTDSVKTQQKEKTKKAAENLLKNLFGKKKKETKKEQTQQEQQEK